MEGSIKLVNTYKLNSSTTKTNRVRFAILNLKLVTLEDDEAGVVEDDDAEEGSDKGRTKRKTSRKLSQKSTTDRSCKAEEMARKDVVSLERILCFLVTVLLFISLPQLD